MTSETGDHYLTLQHGSLAAAVSVHCQLSMTDTSENHASSFYRKIKEI